MTTLHGTAEPSARPDSRRRFLKQTGFGVAVLGMSGCLPSGGADPSLPDGIRDRLRFCSPTEFLVLKAAAEQIVGPLGAEGQPTFDEITLRADEFLSGAEPEIQEQFHQLLMVFNSAIAAFLFDLRPSSFLAMSAQDRSAYLEDWMASPIGFRRTAFMGLKRICMSVSYTHPGLWPLIGYDEIHTL